MALYSFPNQERLFEQLLQLISSSMAAAGKQKRAAIRQLVCKVQEIHTTLLKHLSKEEEQLFPLLLQHFTYAEQVCFLLILHDMSLTHLNNADQV
jgi:zinc finger-like protein